MVVFVVRLRREHLDTFRRSGFDFVEVPVSRHGTPAAAKQLEVRRGFSDGKGEVAAMPSAAGLEAAAAATDEGGGGSMLMLSAVRASLSFFIVDDLRAYTSSSVPACLCFLLLTLYSCSASSCFSLLHLPAPFTACSLHTCFRLRCSCACVNATNRCCMPGIQHSAFSCLSVWLA